MQTYRLPKGRLSPYVIAPQPFRRTYGTAVWLATHI